MDARESKVHVIVMDNCVSSGLLITASFMLSQLHILFYKKPYEDVLCTPSLGGHILNVGIRNGT